MSPRDDSELMSRKYLSHLYKYSARKHVTSEEKKKLFWHRITYKNIGIKKKIETGVAQNILQYIVSEGNRDRNQSSTDTFGDIPSLAIHILEHSSQCGTRATFKSPRELFTNFSTINHLNKLFPLDWHHHLLL